ncbi:hypothetical protein [Enterobacter sp. ENT03]|uniref:hypothetical protein n=1 Tax=Enterobacter sp. ENT03 TaxID=2854780 RepID=UPI001C477625|nr:hypothetical protein [Enterobacter sp. ENT03]MBV7405696.1 hypothetical protein [Enterobacter sp. ENT03]
MTGPFFKLDFKKILQCRRYVASKWKRLIHALLFSYDYNHRRSPDCDLVIFDTCDLKGRKDYTEYMNNFISECQKQRKPEVIKFKYRFMPQHLLGKIKFILMNLKQCTIIELIQLSQLNVLYHIIKNTKLANGKIITFCDAHPEDNLIAQFYKLERHCITYTLQHGYYISAPGTINQEVYRNFVSDYMLCWGQSSKDNLINNGVNERRLLLFGCFKNTLCIPNKINKERNIFVLLNGAHNSETNKYLLDLSLEIIDKTDFDVIIKKHPDDKQNYEINPRIKFVDDLVEGVKNSDVAVLSESGVFIDLYLAKFPFYILCTPLTKPEYLAIPNTISKEHLITLLMDEDPVFKHTKINSLINEINHFSEL